MKQYLPIVLFSFLIFASCKKPSNSDPGNFPSPEAPKISGSILLPTGSNLNVNTLTVQSPFYSTIVKDGKYTLDTLSFYYTTEIVTDASDKIIMMKYNYPNQANYDISSQSTALAILMNSPTALSLSVPAKLKLINDINKNQDFINFVNELEKAIIIGSDYLQPDSNSLVVSAVRKLFATVANMKVAGDLDDPIDIKTAPLRSIAFTAKTACPYIIGIYDENSNQQIEQLVLGGAQVYPTSIKEAFQGYFGGGYGEVPLVIYTFPADGNYQLKIRSGKPGFTSNAFKEELEGFKENLKKVILDLVVGMIGIPITSQCFNSIKAHAGDWVKTVTSIPQYDNSLSDLSSVMHDLSLQFFRSQNDLFKCGFVPSEQVMKKYQEFISKAVKFFDLVSKIGSSLNATAQMISWMKARPAIDTCLRVTATTITACIEPASLSIISGNNQTGSPNRILANPLIVLVKGTDGLPMQGVNVVWERTGGGGGSITPSVNPTNSSGLSTAILKIGPIGPQTVTARVKKNDGTDVTGSPATFSGSDSLAFYRNDLIGSTWLVEAYGPDANGNLVKGQIMNITINANGGTTLQYINGNAGTTAGWDWIITMSQYGYGCILNAGIFAIDLNIIYGQNKYQSIGSGALAYWEWNR